MNAHRSGIIPNPFVDVLVRVLVAEGLWAERTGPDRFQVGRSGPAMEWCCVGDMMFGRDVEDIGERSWVHTVMCEVAVAPSDLARHISRTVRRLTSVNVPLRSTAAG